MDLTLEDFKGEFDEVAFLEKLMAGMKGPANADPNDPSPLQSLFSRTMTTIESLERTVTREILDSSQELIEIDNRHKDNLAEHARALDSLIERFSSLDQTISSVAQTAIRIGSQLEQIDKAKQRSAYGSKMISYFLAMNKENPNVPGFLKSPKFEDLKEAASTIQALQQASQELSRLPNTEHAFKNISSVAGEIENRLLKEFENALQKNDTETMKECAVLLLEFEGGHLIARFIAKCIGALAPSSVDQTRIQSLEQFNNQFSRLIDAIIDTCKRHFALIVDVFPAPDKIIRQLIERIYEDNIAGFLETCLNTPTMNAESFVVGLEIAFDLNRKLVRELTAQVQQLELRESVVVAVSLTFQDHTEGLFCQYRESFIARQQDVFFKELKQSIERATEITRRASVDQGSASLPDSQIEIRILDWIQDVFETNIFDETLKSCRIVLGRCEKLCDPSRLADVIKQVFKTYLGAISKLLLFRVADNLVNAVAEDFSESIPETASCAVQFVGEFDRLMQKFEDFFESEISRRMVESLNVHQKLVQEKLEIIRTLEQKLLVVLNSAIDSIIQHCTRLLSRLQQKSDFRPKEESILPESSGCTNAAAEVGPILKAHTNAATTHLRGKNLDQYLLILGIRFHEILSAHLKSFTVSSGGALQLMRDIREYQDCIREFHIIPVIDRFETLRHVANLFAVTPDNLKTLIDSDPYFMPDHISKEELYAYVRLRADYKQANLKRFFQ